MIKMHFAYQVDTLIVIIVSSCVVLEQDFYLVGERIMVDKESEREKGIFPFLEKKNWPMKYWLTA